MERIPVGAIFLPKFGAKLNTIAFSDKDISRAVTRITHEILEKNKGAEKLTLVGIRTRGVTLAKRIKKKINDKSIAKTFLNVINKELLKIYR